MQDLIQRMMNANPVTNRNPLIGEGNHLLTLENYVTVQTQQFGKALVADFIVDQSDKHPVGSRVSQVWLINRPPAFPNDTKEIDRATDFLFNLLGAESLSTAAQQLVNLIQIDGIGQTNDNEKIQRARGMQVRSTGVYIPPKPSKQRPGQMTKPYTAVSWANVPQTAETIAQNRARVEALAATGVAAPVFIAPQVATALPATPPAAPSFQIPGASVPVATAPSAPAFPGFPMFGGK